MSIALGGPGEVGERDLLQVCDWLDFLNQIMIYTDCNHIKGSSD